MKIFEFFSESNGALSSMRLSMLACVTVALWIAVWGTLHNQVVDLPLVLAILAAGFAGKVVQKGMEEKPEDPKP